MAKIEIIKEENPNGEIWYFVNANESCIKATMDLELAEKIANDYLKNIKIKRTVIFSKELN